MKQGSILNALDALFHSGVIEAIDLELARSIRRRLPDGEAHDLTALAAAFTSRAVQSGHVCLELPRLVERPLLNTEGERIDFKFPPLTEWIAALRSSPSVTDGSKRLPLVLDRHAHLYLHRYFDYQTRLVNALRTRIQEPVAFNETLMQAGLKRLFPATGEPNLQAAAAVIAVSSKLAIVSGGPGTGKTTTVAKLLALLAEQALALGQPFRVTLVAPTGKAAQRLSTAIAASTGGLDTEERVRALIQKPASTIHRTLGYLARQPNQFAHNQHSPLRTDVVLVDEASMVDVALMTKLVEAVPRTAHLILLGDKDQLASVEAGAIFGDIYNAEADHRYSRTLCSRVATLVNTELPGTNDAALPADSTIHLVRSYRYDPSSSIASLARAVREGDVESAFLALNSGHQDVTWLCPKPSTAARGSQSAVAELAELEQTLRDGYSPFVSAQGPAAKLAALAKFRILSPHRQGRLGVTGLNALAERVLCTELNAGHVHHYPGRPIMVTANDYQMDLFNGDIGVIEFNADGTSLAAYFEGPEGLRAIHPSRLPAHETVFAMTVHKSQGSEFDRIVLVLPEEPSPILTRELLYTALTRARTGVIIRGTRSVLAAGIDARVQRASGLRDALWA